MHFSTKRLKSTWIYAFLFVVAALPIASIAQDWPKYRYNIYNQGMSPGSSTGFTNYNMELKWKFNAGAPVTAEPAVVTINGTSTVFVGDWNGTFHAINAVTGQQLWSFQIDAIPGCTQIAPLSCKVIASSAAVVNNLVYFGAHNAFLYALDAATGAVVWKTQLADANLNYAIWSSPLVYNGLVYVGLANSGTNHPCVFGQVVAVKASTGAVQWRFNTIDESSCQSGNQCQGASVWSSPATDGSFLYVGTGQPGTNCKPATPYASRYPDSILSLNLTNGSLVSHFQADANDFQGDLDIGSSPVISQFEGGSVVEGSKDGKMWICKVANGVLRDCTAVFLDGTRIIASPAECHGHDTFPGRAPQSIFANIWMATTGGNLYSIYWDSRTGLHTPSIELSTFPYGIFSAPAVTGGACAITGIFVGSDNGRLYNIGGTPPFFTTAGTVQSGVSVSNGRVYFGSHDGNVYCLGEPATVDSISATALSPSSVSPGGSATSKITVAAAGGFKASVTLSCSSIDLNGASATMVPPACSFNPATIANGAGTSTLTVTTTGATALLTRPRMRRLDGDYATWLPIGGLALIGAGLVPTASGRRKLLALMLTCMALIGLVLLAACGGGSGSGTGGGGGGGGGGRSSGTPAGTYTITVSASATGLQTQTTTLTLTVQ